LSFFGKAPGGHAVPYPESGRHETLKVDFMVSVFINVIEVSKSILIPEEMQKPPGDCVLP